MLTICFYPNSVLWSILINQNPFIIFIYQKKLLPYTFRSQLSIRFLTLSRFPLLLSGMLTSSHRASFFLTSFHITITILLKNYTNSYFFTHVVQSKDSLSSSFLRLRKTDSNDNPIVIQILIALLISLPVSQHSWARENQPYSFLPPNEI